MLSREELMRFIPKPTNEDVIIYDISLKDLIDTDVVKEYNNLYPIFFQKKSRYSLISEELKAYEKNIDNIYLYNKSWNKEDYLQMLQQEKKTYSILFGDLKRLENNINTLKRQISAIDTKIELQIEKDNQKIEQKKEEIEKIIQVNKGKIIDYKSKLDTYNLLLENVNNEIQQNENEFQFLSEMDSELKNGEYKCKYCGSTVKVHNENSLIYKRLFKNIEGNKLVLQKLLAKKNELEKYKNYYEDEISNLKSQLNNAIEFRKENFNFYQKKSPEVLNLEAFRNELINNVSELEKTFKSKPQANSDEFKKIKEKISKYELSLNNLENISQLKEKFSQKSEEFSNLKTELKEMYQKLNHYKKFLTYFYKIYEQKAADFFGAEFKFKVFEFDDVALNIIFEITYKGINYNELDYQTREKLDEMFAEKIPNFI